MARKKRSNKTDVKPKVVTPKKKGVPEVKTAIKKRMVKTKLIKCPNCSKKFTYELAVEVASTETCPYCGTEVQVEIKRNLNR